MADLQHAFISSSIVDNTIIQDTTEQTTIVENVLNRTVGFFFILSNEGPINKPVLCRTASEAKVFGTPSTRKYGFSHRQALNFIENNGFAFIMRCAPVSNSVTPQIVPASISNLFLDIQTKREALVGAAPATSVAAVATAITTDSIGVEYNVALALPASVEIGDNIYYNKQIFPATLGYTAMTESEKDAAIATPTIDVYVYDTGTSSYVGPLDDNTTTPTRAVALADSPPNIIVALKQLQFATTEIFYIAEGTGLSIVNLDTADMTATYSDGTTQLSGANGIKYVAAGSTEIPTTSFAFRLTGGTDVTVSHLNKQCLLKNSTGDVIGYATIKKIVKVNATALDLDNVDSSCAIKIQSGATSMSGTLCDNANSSATYCYIYSDDATAVANASVTTKTYSVITAKATASFKFKAFGVMADIAPSNVLAAALLTDIAAKPARVTLRPKFVSARFSKEKDLERFMINPYSDPLFTETTSDGFKRHIFYGFSKSATEDANEYKIKIATNSSSDNDVLTPFRVYDISFYKTVAGVDNLVEGPFTCSFDSSAMSSANQSSMWISSVLSQYGKNFKHYHNPVVYDALLADIDELSATAPAFTIEEVGYIDVMFGTERNARNRTGLEHTNIEILTDVAIDKIGGVSADLPKYVDGSLVNKNYTFNGVTVVESVDGFKNMLLGTIGSLNGYKADGSAMTIAELDALKEQLIIDGLAGVLNADVYNKHAYPCDILFDAKLSIGIKEAMVNFATSRQDCFVVLDTADGAASYLNDMAYRQNELRNIDTFRVAIYGQEIEIYDETEKTNMLVSPVYFLTKMIPSRDISFGTYEKIAGVETVISGLDNEDLSYLPTPTQESALAENRINYMIYDFVYGVRFNSQLTSQYKNSALSDIPNVRALLKMIRRIEYAAEKFKFNRSNVVDSGLASAVATECIPFIGTAFASVTPTVYASDIDKAKRIRRVSLEVTTIDFVQTFYFTFTITR